MGEHRDNSEIDLSSGELLLSRLPWKEVKIVESVSLGLELCSNRWGCCVNNKVDRDVRDL